jgi:GT2 family glycosyltransferase
VPTLSVLLPVRNAAPWLGASLASLARQTMRDFEIVAVDDGSTDGTGEALERAARREPRLIVVRTPARGLPQALETACARATAPYLARHDGDDVSHRLRFERQLAFLGAHRDVAVVGCRLRLFPAGRTAAGMRRWAAWHNAQLTHEAMARDALIDSPLAHGTALFRRAALERAGGWRDAGWAEDLDLWLRMLECGARFGKCGEMLYAWRQHAASATRSDPRYAPEQFLALKCAALGRGLLAGAPRVTVVGVGTSLTRWAEALAAPGREVRALIAPRALPALEPPAVLVFGSWPAREARRAVLAARGLREGTDFAFVA